VQQVGVNFAFGMMIVVVDACDFANFIRAIGRIVY